MHDGRRAVSRSEGRVRNTVEGSVRPAETGEESMDDCRARDVRVAQASIDATPGGEPESWLPRLRGRLDRGELDDLRRVTLDNGLPLVNVALAARRLLDELADLDALPPARRDRGFARTRRRRALDTLERLRRALEG
jgi:hypothetical protein